MQTLKNTLLFSLSSSLCLGSSLFGVTSTATPMSTPTTTLPPASSSQSAPVKNAPSYTIPIQTSTRAGHPVPHLPQVQEPPPIIENPQRPTHDEAQEIMEVIENQLNAVQSKDYHTAYYEYASEPLRQRTTFEGFVQYVKHYGVLNHNKNALFGNPEYRKNVAVLKGTLTGTDGSSYKAEYHLIKEGNQWKVNGLQLIPMAPPVPKPVQAGANYDFQSDISH